MRMVSARRLVAAILAVLVSCMPFMARASFGQGEAHEICSPAGLVKVYLDVNGERLAAPSAQSTGDHCPLCSPGMVRTIDAFRADRIAAESAPVRSLPAPPGARECFPAPPATGPPSAA